MRTGMFDLVDNYGLQRRTYQDHLSKTKITHFLKEQRSREDVTIPLLFEIRLPNDVCIQIVIFAGQWDHQQMSFWVTQMISNFLESSPKEAALEVIFRWEVN